MSVITYIGSFWRCCCQCVSESYGVIITKIAPNGTKILRLSGEKYYNVDDIFLDTKIFSETFRNKNCH